MVEAPDGPSVAWMHDQATTLGCWIAGSLPIDTGTGRPRNCWWWPAPTGRRLPTTSATLQLRQGTRDGKGRGDDLATVEIDGMNWGLTVCYDLRFSYDYWSRYRGGRIPGGGQLASSSPRALAGAAAGLERWRTWPMWWG